ncbi:MAG: hypothetical protein OSA98_24310 [Rubripirellula sp.]|nr:hypothetical protein [Rubripirellula sp.]
MLISSRLSVLCLALLAITTPSVLDAADTSKLGDAGSGDPVLEFKEGKKGLNAVNVKVVSVGPSDVMTEVPMAALVALNWLFPISETAEFMDVVWGLMNQTATDDRKSGDRKSGDRKSGDRKSKATDKNKVKFKAGSDLAGSVN